MNFFKKYKYVLISCVILISLVLSIFLIINNKDKINQNNIKKYGEIKVQTEEEKNKEKTMQEKNAEVLTKEDLYGNKYTKRGLVTEGIMFDVPKGFKAVKDKETYYIMPSENDDLNFSEMFTMRFYKNAKWKKESPEYAKNHLMDGTKSAIKYKNAELNEDFYLSHLNRGKARKMDETLLFEESKKSKFVSPTDPSKIMELYSSFTYIPLLNTNVEIGAISPFAKAEQLNEVQESIVSSVTEYNPLPYTNKKPLNKIVKGKGFETMLSKDYKDIDNRGNYVLALISNEPFDADYDMTITVGKYKRDKKKEKDIDISKTSPELARFVYLSWFHFAEEGTRINIEHSNKVKSTTVNGKEAFLHDYVLFAENEINSMVNTIINPANVTMYAVKLNDTETGFIAIRHTPYNKEIAQSIIKEIAQKTKFN